jgi:nicotinate-nucleotide adenylyltransferase
MNIALFGGTFDPLHVGHLLVAESAREKASLGRVVFLPTFQPPHKEKVAASANDRLAMTRLAVANNPAFTVSDWEVKQRRKVYTYEALAHFRRLWPKDRLHFIVGSDSLRDIRKWREGERLLSQATFLIVDRAEAPWDSIPPALRKRVRLIRCPYFPFASHLLRRRIARGESTRYEIPEAVRRYISRRRLYRSSRRVS